MKNSGAPHTTGNTYGTNYRQGCCPVVHSYPLSYTQSGTAILVDTIKAASDNPVQVKVSCQIVTVFNAGTGAPNNIVSAGTSTTANEWLAAANTTATTLGYYPANNAVYKQRLTADTPIYVKYTQTSTAATTGQAVIFVEEYQEETESIT